MIDKTNIKRIKAENEYQRKTMAFKILIEKELEFYEKYYEYASKFITYIQDITFNLNKGNFETYINYTIKTLELIPLFKRDVLLDNDCDNLLMEFSVINTLIKKREQDMVES